MLASEARRPSPQFVPLAGLKWVPALDLLMAMSQEQTLGCRAGANRLALQAKVAARRL